VKYFGLITVRSDSTRLKKKCLLKFGKVNVLEHIIMRALKSKIVPIVCTTTNKSDSILEKISKKYKVKCFRGSVKNKIKRWHDCAKKNKINFFHTIDADDPFFDPLAIKKSLLECKSNNDIIFPSRVSRSGGASEGYSFSFGAISKLNHLVKQLRKNHNSTDTEMIEKFIDYKIFTTKTLEGSKYELKKARLTLDYQEDYKMLTEIRDSCGNFASRKKINNFLKKNKDILKINFFRNICWEKRQKKLLVI
jgi:spore coat polysaccharide biosynthesis protein SpsF|tara:strand:+ start:7474 stop:8223 length:750 start_codon:yes stop_codon:yes gene_type:complete